MNVPSHPEGVDRLSDIHKAINFLNSSNGHYLQLGRGHNAETEKENHVDCLHCQVIMVNMSKGVWLTSTHSPPPPCQSSALLPPADSIYLVSR